MKDTCPVCMEMIKFNYLDTFIECPDCKAMVYNNAGALIIPKKHLK